MIDVGQRFGGGTPLLSGDGSRLVLITRATLDLVDDDPRVGCRVVTYDIGSRRLAYVTGFPTGFTLQAPSLSSDGRWLAFSATGSTNDQQRRQGTAALLDVESGRLEPDLTADRAYPTFDSIVTRDGRSVVVTSQSDLDPSGGNADHNMEVFVLDRESRRFVQVTHTTGGYGANAGTCLPYTPAVSANGRALVLKFWGDSYVGCRLDGPERHTSTGLYYRFALAVIARPENRAPEWTPPTTVRVTAGTTLTLNVSATDADGDPLIFFAQELDEIDVPRGSVIEDHYDGTATFRWPTRIEQAGEYTVRLAVFDQVGGERVHDVHITVGAAEPGPCPGDCDGDAVVGVAELVAGVRIALQESAAESCAAADTDADGRVSVDELIRATGAALNGC